MNNKNKILVGCLALLLVLSVGYALFSETITINGTATAKGNFDIEFLCASTNAVGDATGDCSISGQTVTTKSNLTKPNEVVSYSITLTNNGTIPALLKNATSPNNIKVDGYVTGESGDQSYYDVNTAVGASYFVIDLEGERIIGDSAVEEANIILQPEDTITVVVSHGWIDKGDEQPVLPEAGTSLSYNVSFDFEQLVTN